MKRQWLRVLVALAVLGSFGWYQWQGHAPGAAISSHARQDNAALAKAFADHASNIQVEGHGVVAAVLPDDTRGLRHQRFIVQLPSGQRILIAHNIDLAPRLPGLKRGDSVAFAGEYEWNAKGGVVHWTHRDPRGRHAPGWLHYKGEVFQ